MDIENHKEEVPLGYYQKEFEKAHVEEILGRLSDVTWENGAFQVEMLGKVYTICHPDARVTPDCPLPVQTFLLRYLLKGRQIPFAGSFLTFRQMPWGELYIKPYTGRVLTRAAFTFGPRLENFRSACEKMGGILLPHADVGYQLPFIGDYTVQVLVWEADEDFPPSAQILYSDNFKDGFEPEDRVVAGDLIISAIKENM